MRELIRAGAAAMGIALPDDAPDKLVIYHEMLVETNRVMNLTRVPDDPAEAVDRNYLDSLAPLAAPHLMENVKTLCDVGTGAGFPGVPLSIARPDIHVVLMDALGKRVKFLQSVIDRLNLNAEAVHIRAEDAAKLPDCRDRFDLAVARAVAALPVLCELTLPFVKAGGRFIAYKGPSLDEELSQSGAILKRMKSECLETRSVAFPGRDWDHRLCVVRKNAPTPASFPRKAGEAGRNPILR